MTVHEVNAEQPRHYTIGHGALLHAIEKNTLHVDVPGIGEVRLPSGETLAWFGGLTTLAVLGIVEWPVAAAIGVGHLLAHNQHMRVLRDFGEALEEA